jgi:UV DNA damage repair endonuclease
MAAGQFGACLTSAVLCLLRPAVRAVQVFDLMGYRPSHWNKVNIHVGAVHGGSKAAALHRFAAAVERLSPGCRARLTGAWELRCAGLGWAWAWA